LDPTAKGEVVVSVKTTGNPSLFAILHEMARKSKKMLEMDKIRLFLFQDS